MLARLLDETEALKHYLSQKEGKISIVESADLQHLQTNLAEIQSQLVQPDEKVQSVHLQDILQHHLQSQSVTSKKNDTAKNICYELQYVPSSAKEGNIDVKEMDQRLTALEHIIGHSSASVHFILFFVLSHISFR